MIEHVFEETPAPGPSRPTGWSVSSSGCPRYAFLDDAQVLYEEWVDVPVPDPVTGGRVVAPADTGSGLREFAIVDRTGNLLRVGSPKAP